MLKFLKDNWLDSVVAIGRRADRESIDWLGTGFILSDTRLKIVALVTCQHVVQDETDLVVRVNHAGEERSTIIDLCRGDLPYFVTFHPGGEDVDLAAVALPKRAIPEDKFVVTQPPEVTTRLSELEERGIREGTDVLVIGFWPKWAGDVSNSPIVRQGVIAQARDVIRGREHRLLVDCLVFPGTSGAPVVALRGDIRNAGTIIGVVAKHQYYQEDLTSEQTGCLLERRLHNAGLAEVIPIDRAYEVLEEHAKRLK